MTYFILFILPSKRWGRCRHICFEPYGWRFSHHLEWHASQWCGLLCNHSRWSSGNRQDTFQIRDGGYLLDYVGGVFFARVTHQIIITSGELQTLSVMFAMKEKEAHSPGSRVQKGGSNQPINYFENSHGHFFKKFNCQKVAALTWREISPIYCSPKSTDALVTVPNPYNCPGVSWRKEFQPMEIHFGKKTSEDKRDTSPYSSCVVIHVSRRLGSPIWLKTATWTLCL